MPRHSSPTEDLAKSHLHRKCHSPKRIFVYLAAATLCCLSPACRSNDGTPKYQPIDADKTPVSGGLYVEASIADASMLNPILCSDSASSDINGLVYNGLVKYDKDIKLIGDLAEKWEISNEGKDLTFHLRKNVKWHDGQQFTSDDVKFTYEMLISSYTRTPFASDFLLVSSVETPDPFTFKVHYKQPFSPALESWGMGIIPKHIFQTGDINTHPANRKPIGTGPYIFQTWKTDQKIVLTANPDYFEGRPLIDKYIYYIIPDQSVQFLELRQGTLSHMNPTPDQYNGYQKFFRSYNKFRYPAFQYSYIGFNLKNPLFQDKRVRTALAHAINKKAIVEGVYQGLAIPATGPFPPASWACNPDVKGPEYDPQKALALLKDAGWEDHNGDGILDKDGKDFKFTLITNNANKVREMMAQVVQNDFKKIGVQMEIRLLEWTVFIHQYIDARVFEAVLLAWNLGRDPDAYAIWHSGQTGPNQYNFVSYSNPEVDTLLIQGRQTFGEEKRKPIYHKIHALITDDVPYIFLVVPETTPVVHKKIMGVEQAPAGLGWNFIHWYIPKRWQNRYSFAAQ